MSDTRRTLDMTIGKKTWKCAGWMAIQAHEYIQMVKMFPEDLQLAVKGDGLLAGILSYAAGQAEKEQE